MLFDFFNRVSDLKDNINRNIFGSLDMKNKLIAKYGQDIQKN